MKQLDLSISIVAFNTKDDLDKCLASIYKHTKKITYEIFVVDNGSRDGTPQLVKRKYPQVKLTVHKKNKYFTKPNNESLKKANGRNFLILNADTWFVDNSLRKMVLFLDEHHTIGAIEGLEIYENGSFLPNGSRFSTPLIDFYELSILGRRFRLNKQVMRYRYSKKKRDETFDVDVGCDAFLMVKTKIMKQIKGYDEKFLLYYTENDLCMRIKKESYRIVHLGGAKVFHKVSVSANKLKWKKLEIYYKDLLQYYKKHGYFLSGVLLYILLKIELVILRVFRPHMFS